MNWLAIVIFIVLFGFVTWLVVDTILYTIRKVKEKKNKNKDKVDNNTEK